MVYKKIGDPNKSRNSITNHSTNITWPANIIANSTQKVFSIIIEDNSLKYVFEEFYRKTIASNIKVYHSGENVYDIDSKIKGKKVILENLSKVRKANCTNYLALLDLDYDKITKNKTYLTALADSKIIYTEMYSLENYFFNFDLLKSQVTSVGDISENTITLRLEKDKDTFINTLLEFYNTNLPKILALHKIGQKSVISSHISSYIDMTSSDIVKLIIPRFFEEIVDKLSPNDKKKYYDFNKQFRYEIDKLIAKHGINNTILSLIPGKRLFEHYLHYSGVVFDNLVSCINSKDPNCNCSRCKNRIDLNLDTKTFLLRYIYHPTFYTDQVTNYFNLIKSSYLNWSINQ